MPTLTRRTVLAVGAVATGVAVAGGVQVVRRRPLPLELAVLQPLVGSRVRVEGRTVTLSAVTGPGDARPTAKTFHLTFTASRPLGLPGEIRTLEHAEGDLVVHVEPVGAKGTALEAVVNRSA